jgi:hypothetical protein
MDWNDDDRERHRMTKPKLEQPLHETPERLRQANGRVEEVTIKDENGQQHSRRQFLDGHTLRWLESRGKIDGYQLAAGEQFYADWYASGLAPSGVIDPAKEPVDGSPPSSISETRMAARDRYRKAVRALDWVHLHAINAVVINEKSLETYGDETQSRWYKTSDYRVVAVLTILRQALTKLDEHYSGKRHSNGIAASIREDGRPTDRPELREKIR